MSRDYDSLTNRGEYLSAHYLAEDLDTDLRKGLFAVWTGREGDENDPRRTPRELIRGLRGSYLGEDGRRYFAAAAEADGDGPIRLATYDNPEWRKRLTEWHQEVLRALGFDPAPVELVAHRAGRDHTVTVALHTGEIIAMDCGWTGNADAALDPNGAGRLLHPLHVSGSERYESGAALASWLFQSEIGGPGGTRPRFVLLLHGGVIILADRGTWAEGRYLAANLDTALERYDRTQTGELSSIAALFSWDMLRPGDNDPTRRIDVLLKNSSANAVGVSKELRHGLQRSVEILANEVLRRMAEPANNVRPEDIESPKLPFARELTRECLRYLYRILFLLFAEARPELGILPTDDGSYESGYSMARLRELCARDEELVEEEARNGFHLYASLDVLFNKVNFGHRKYGTEPDDDLPGDDEETRREKAERRSDDHGLRFEALRSTLLEPGAIRLIGGRTLDPRSDEDENPRWLDLRPRNVALHEVLRLLTLKQGKNGERGGFVSYRNLGINQLGAVYEGLMSYTGIIADEDLCEVAHEGKPEEGSWLVPAHRQQDYPDETLVRYDEADARHGLRGVKKYPKGSFVYRLSGRERETSASYYTPESLTKVTVELALKERLDQERDTDGKTIKTRAAELLSYRLCEPALGSGAFLNEAINQVAEEYLRRRQDELRRSIPSGQVLTEKQRVKAYIALHNAYGVDLNPTGVELAEVSLWLNTMHPGMLAPWFGLHLRRGNSLIGARRAVYAAEDVCSTAKEWLKAKGGLAPTPLPMRDEDGNLQPLPTDAVHQFLLPTPGWAAAAANTEAKQLSTDQNKQLADWKKGILQRPTRNTSHLKSDGTPKLVTRTQQPQPEKPSQFTRLRDAARRAEFLWTAVVKRMEMSERNIARRIPIWGAGAEEPEYGFLHLPERSTSKEQVLQDLFEAVDTPYWRLKLVMDAWCALWYWPADQARLLDGSDEEYAVSGSITRDSLASLIDTTIPGTEPLVGLTQQETTTAAAPSVPAARTMISRPMTLFAMPGDQTAFDDLGWGLEPEPAHAPQQPQKKAAKKTPKSSAPPLRRVIPLKNLDDWLDFLEAVLGTADIPQDSFLDAFEDLDELKKFEEFLPQFMGMDTKPPEERFPWLRVVRDIADRQGFLHWELEFALIFAQRDGFDLQVGNPPWVRPRWDADAVMAEYEPWFKLADRPSESDKERRRRELLTRPDVKAFVLDELTNNSATAALLGSPQMYPLLAGTVPDLYRAFMCQVWDHTSHWGAVGLLHPDTHFVGEREGPLRAAAYHRLRIHGDFVNSGQRFFPRPVGDTAHFGIHIYGRAREIGFDHLSWLVSTDALRLSRDHDGSGEVPGIRFMNREFDERPHRSRVVAVDEEVLAVWRKLLDEEDRPLNQARLLFPVSTGEASAIEALAAYPLRLSALNLQISDGFNEAGAKKANLIDYNRKDPKTGREYQPDSWSNIILKGTQLGLATPVFKRHDANSNDPYGVDLVSLPPDFIPDTAYVAVRGRTEEYRRAQIRWTDYAELARLRSDDAALGDARALVAEMENIPESDIDPEKTDAILIQKSRRPYVDFHRLAWRRQIASNTERALYAALIPPGPAHIDAMHTLTMPSNLLTVLVAGFWASLPLDYLLRATGRGDLRVAGVKALPAPDEDHPLTPALLLRILRLNCLTSAYRDLWAELYDSEWAATEAWALDWAGARSLSEIGPEWTLETPLRSERDRRAALVEIDALVAVWLGMSAEALVAAYRGRFPVLQKYEAVTWFDADGWKLAGNARTIGQRQTKATWAQFEAYQNDKSEPKTVAPPEGFTPPFYKADRVAEMKAAHAVFQARLNAAIARGEWDPVTRKAAKQ
ncbi:class I SAM-dependent DNA methyltransferase [Micromonospora sp. RTP1Z1]|uniref:class I SAM-dependent DNA methyltransferase n=1 Tax=Micromonospora sp. RTP1Z1 TaxID=2994043 RepID=UPI0029C9921C|nr:class I SAM-dependent DNA methyltransferase [Micromonospora sp. RTP1Z1]